MADRSDPISGFTAFFISRTVFPVRTSFRILSGRTLLLRFLLLLVLQHLAELGLIELAVHAFFRQQLVV